MRRGGPLRAHKMRILFSAGKRPVLGWKDASSLAAGVAKQGDIQGTT